MKCTVKVDEKLQKELNESIWIKSLIALIVGAVGLAIYIVVGVFVEDNLFWDIFLWVMAILFGYGLTMLVTIKKTNKKSVLNNFTDDIELFEDRVEETIKKGDDIISTTKHYYKDLFKIRETENYLFLYPNKMGAVPVPKKAFSPEEFSKIKLWVNSAKAKKTN